ncbi:MAG TPA: extracellular solute-binding protein [Gaiellaceae bacterium]|jgi:iron(III) transport system substrate-binding protein
MKRLIAAAALAATLAGCGGSGSSSRSIVLYNGQHLQLTQAFIAGFKKATGISVQLRTNDSLVLATQILQEGGGSPADVYLSENSPELETLSKHGVLARLPASILDQIPRADESPAGDWVGVALRVSSLAYDPSLLARSSLPRSVLDLAQPRWNGKVAIAPTDSDFPPVVGAVITTYGMKAATAWLTGLKRNAQVYQDEEAVVAAVNRGSVASGLINQYYWYRLRLETRAGGMHSALYFFPGHDPGSITNISGAAVLASSRHKDDAERFVRFLVGAAGQKILAASDDFEYPARPGIAANPALPPLDSVSHAAVPVRRLGDDDSAAKLIQKVGLT